MEVLESALKELQISYTPQNIEQFRQYMNGILEWNEKINLTAIKDKEEFLVKHFIDSLLCLNYREYKSANNIIDVGTGAGFPGVPLAILSPAKEFLLMDSLNKRLKVIEELAAQIELNNVKILHARAEELARRKEHREMYDLCVSRAVANLTVLSEYCLPFIKVGGYLLAYKGPEGERETEEAAKAIDLLGGKVEKIENMKLSHFDLNHKIIFIKKVKKTPSKFPRKSGTPAKEPLK